MRYILYSQILLSLWRVGEAIQCFSCTSNDKAGKFCRKVSEAQIITCPNDSTFCNALVFLKNGAVNVDRGCGGSVSSWGFGRTECDIMSNDALMDVGVAFYQCRGDVCNNIEPADDVPAPKDNGVVLLTKTVEQADSGSGLASNAGASAGASASAKAHGSAFAGDDDDEGAGYGPPKPKPVRPPPPPPPPVRTKPPAYPQDDTTEAPPPYVPPKPSRPPPPPPTQRAYPTTQEVEIEETEESVPYAPVTKPRPSPPPPPVRTKPPPPAYPEDTTEAPPPYQPPKPPAPKPVPPPYVPPPPPPPVRTRPPPPAYPVDTTEAPPPYQPPKPPAPKPTPAPYVPPVTKDIGYGGNEDEDTEAPIFTTRAPVRTPGYQIKEVETDEPYAPRPTTTTPRRTRPDYGAEVINTEETVVTFRPTRRPRTVFDRKRRDVD